jgi:hypothetical protein
LTDAFSSLRMRRGKTRTLATRRLKID